MITWAACVGAESAPSSVCASSMHTRSSPPVLRQGSSGQGGRLRCLQAGVNEALPLRVRRARPFPTSSFLSTFLQFADLYLLENNDAENDLEIALQTWTSKGAAM